MKKIAFLLMVICMALGVQAQRVEQMPSFPGGDAALMKYVSSHIHYPKEAADWNFCGKVVVRFVVTKTGEVGEVKIVSSQNKELDQELISVCQELPKFIPGRINGQPVDMWYTLPVMFSIQTGEDTKLTIADEINTTTEPSGKVYETVDRMPTFPGGRAALLKFIISHIRYPKSVVEGNVEGKVVVRFVVKESGQVGEVKVESSVDEDLGKEVVRVCKSLPKFVPGRQDGQPVAVWYTLPITIDL